MEGRIRAGFPGRSFAMSWCCISWPKRRRTRLQFMCTGRSCFLGSERLSCGGITTATPETRINAPNPCLWPLSNAIGRARKPQKQCPRGIGGLKVACCSLLLVARKIRSETDFTACAQTQGIEQSSGCARRFRTSTSGSVPRSVCPGAIGLS